MDVKVLASGSTGNCYRISDHRTSVLLDAGIQFRGIQEGCGFNVTGLAGCLITHDHNDHARSAAELMKRSVDVYTSYGTAESREWLGKEGRTQGIPAHRLHIVHDMESFRIGSFVVTAFGVEHDSPESLGFAIYSKETDDKLMYFTDTYYIKYRFNGLTHILCECNYDREILYDNIKTGKVEPFVARRLMKTHMSIDTLLDTLRLTDLSRVRQIYLLHISGSNGNVSEFKRRVQALTGAEVYACS